MRFLPRNTYKLAFIAAVLAGCGGGGGGGTNTAGGTGTGANPPADNSVVLTAACTEGSDYLCSGRDILRVDRRVSLTENGVQVYAHSTSDLRPDNPNHTVAHGLMLTDCTSPSTCGVAEVRKEKAANGRLVLLLDRMGLQWDRRTERPLIIDTFSTLMGRATVDSNNVVRFSTNLPGPEDLSFYDWAVRGANGTQGNYANNVYFPRDWPVRCPGDWPDCPDRESEGVQHTSGDWQNGGLTPDRASAARFHGEGDLRAGDDTRDPVTGQRRWIDDSDGFGPSYPGFKGYRTIENRSYRYANLATWLTADTVNIVEWVTDNLAPYEHVKFRRGMVAYGDLTAPAALPGSGTTQYRGLVHGMYAADSSASETPFIGDANISVNFATGQATVAITNTRTHDSAGNPVFLPIEFTSVTTLDPSGTGLRNYSSGAAASTSMQGGVSTRLFGPVVSGGTSSAGPAEIGGTFALNSTTNGRTAIAGFIARKQ